MLYLLILSDLQGKRPQTLFENMEMKWCEVTSSCQVFCIRCFSLFSVYGCITSCTSWHPKPLLGTSTSFKLSPHAYEGSSSQLCSMARGQHLNTPNHSTEILSTYEIVVTCPENNLLLRSVYCQDFPGWISAPLCLLIGMTIRPQSSGWVGRYSFRMHS